MSFRVTPSGEISCDTMDEAMALQQRVVQRGGLPVVLPGKQHASGLAKVGSTPVAGQSRFSFSSDEPTAGAGANGEPANQPACKETPGVASDAGDAAPTPRRKRGPGRPKQEPGEAPEPKFPPGQGDWNQFLAELDVDSDPARMLLVLVQHPAGITGQFLTSELGRTSRDMGPMLKSLYSVSDRARINRDELLVRESGMVDRKQVSRYWLPDVSLEHLRPWAAQAFPSQQQPESAPVVGV